MWIWGGGNVTSTHKIGLGVLRQRMPPGARFSPLRPPPWLPTGDGMRKWETSCLSLFKQTFLWSSHGTAHSCLLASPHPIPASLNALFPNLFYPDLPFKFTSPLLEALYDCPQPKVAPLSLTPSGWDWGLSFSICKMGMWDPGRHPSGPGMQ